MTYNRPNWLVIAAIVAVVILGGVWWARSASRPSPVAALQKLSQASTLHATAELEIQLPTTFRRNQERPFTVLTSRVEGDVQYRDTTPELTGTLFMEAKGRGNTFFANGDLRILHDAVAFRLENLPVLLNPSGSLIRRWTYVPTNPLATQNGAQIRASLRSLFQNLKYEGTDTINGATAHRYSGRLTEEQEAALVGQLQKSTSGSSAWHIAARLLEASNVDTIQVWVERGSLEIPRMEITFVSPAGEGQTRPVAKLRLAFTEYGKKVTIDRPRQEATVRPDVFGRLFGTGEVEAQ
jgi:hypothetical protein